MQSIRDAAAEKLHILQADRPTDGQFVKWLHDSDLWMCIYSALRAQGTELGKRELVEMLQGTIIGELPLELYFYVHRFDELYADMRDCMIMQSDPDRRIMDSWRKILFDREGYRKDNSAIYRWGHIPPHFHAISDELTQLLRSRPVSDGLDGFDEAVLQFLGFLALYPFGEDSVSMAYALLLYDLMRLGIPMPSFDVDQEEFDGLLMQYFSDGDPSAWLDLAHRSLLNRLEQIVMLMQAAKEQA